MGIYPIKFSCSNPGEHYNFFERCVSALVYINSPHTHNEVIQKWHVIFYIRNTREVSSKRKTKIVISCLRFKSKASTCLLQISFYYYIQKLKIGTLNQAPSYLLLASLLKFGSMLLRLELEKKVPKFNDNQQKKVIYKLPISIFYQIIFQYQRHFFYPQSLVQFSLAHSGSGVSYDHPGPAYFNACKYITSS